jgi:hypothetical protein
MDRTANWCSHGGWLSLALFVVFPLLWVLWFIFYWQGFIIILRITLVLYKNDLPDRLSSLF